MIPYGPGYDVKEYNWHWRAFQTFNISHLYSVLSRLCCAKQGVGGNWSSQWSVYLGLCLFFLSLIILGWTELSYHPDRGL